MAIELVEVEYLKGGRRRKMRKAAAVILEKIGKVRRVPAEAPVPEKKKRGRPPKLVEVEAAPEKKSAPDPENKKGRPALMEKDGRLVAGYRRRDLRADD